MMKRKVKAPWEVKRFKIGPFYISCFLDAWYWMFRRLHKGSKEWILALGPFRICNWQDKEEKDDY
jgi:hypothetical protein